MSYPKIESQASTPLDPPGTSLGAISPRRKRPAVVDFLSAGMRALTAKMTHKGKDEAPTAYRPLLSRPDIAESEPGAGQMQSVPAPTPGLYDQSLAALVAQRYTDGIAHRQRHHAGWMESLAAFRCQSWHFWNGSELTHWRTLDPNQPYRVWSSHGLIRPRVRKLIARAFATEVNWTFAPESDMEDDKDATDELRVTFDHIGVINDWPGLKKRVERGAISFCPHAIKVCIDPQAKLHLPYWGIDPESNEAYVEKIVDAIGPEIKLYDCTAFDFTLDPRAKSPRHAAWVIFDNPMTYDEVRRRFPEKAIYLNESATQQGPGAGGQDMIRSVTGDLPIGATPSGQSTVWVREMWEKPSLLYPKGRVAWVTQNGLLLQESEFPEGLEHLPIVVLSYDEGLESPFGMSATQAGLPAAQSHDAMVSAFQERARERGKILYQTGLGIKHDALQSGRGYEAIPLDLTQSIGGIGNVLMYIQPPALPTEAAALLAQANADLSEAIEAQDVSRGQVPSGVTSGSGIRALQEADASTAVLFRENCRAAYQHLGEILQQLAPIVYGNLSRVLAQSEQPQSGERGVDAMQETALLMETLRKIGATPEQIVQYLADDEARPAPEPEVRPRSTPKVFRALARGRVRVTAEVIAIRTPEQRRSDLMTLAQGGAFNEENIESTLALFEEIGFQESDRLTRRLVKALRRRVAEKQASAPDPASIAKAQAEAQEKSQIAIANARIRAETASAAILEDLRHQNGVAKAVTDGSAIDTDPVVQQELAPRLDATAQQVTAAFDAASLQGGEEAPPESLDASGGAPSAPDPTVPPETASPGAPQNLGGGESALISDSLEV